VPNFPELMDAFDGNDWYAENDEGNMERVLVWGLLSSGRIIPVFAGDARMASSFKGRRFYHPSQYLDEGTKPEPYRAEG
jgi:hypothetical protein